VPVVPSRALLLVAPEIVLAVMDTMSLSEVDEDFRTVVVSPMHTRRTIAASSSPRRSSTA
jgi:hypothetical protein